MNISTETIHKFHDCVLEAFNSNYYEDSGQEVFSEVDHYVSRQFTSDRVPLLVVGDCGSGKSACMASIIRSHIMMKQSQKMFFHFAGSAPYSTSLHSFLNRLITEFEITNDSSETDVDSCSHVIRRYLESDATCTIFVDGLHELDGGDQNITWFYKLGPNIRLIFSVLSNSMELERIKQFYKNVTCIELKKLNLIPEKDMIKSALKTSGIELNVDQILSLLSNEIINPYWITLACREIAEVNKNGKLSDDKLLKYIDSLPPSVDELHHLAIARLENSNPLFLPLLCFIATSHTGLTKSELSALLDSYISNDSLLDAERSDFDVEALLSDISDLLQIDCDTAEKEFPRTFSHKRFRHAVTNYWECCDVWEWHERLSEYFEHSTNFDRQLMEYPHHLMECIESIYDERAYYVERMQRYLLNWDVFDALYSTEHSTQLVRYWSCAGINTTMPSSYAHALHDVESDYTVSEAQLSDRYQKFSRFCMQAGAYSSAQMYAERARALEDDEIEPHPERMVEIYSLLASIWDQKCKLHEWINQEQISEQRETIRYCRKAIELRTELSQNSVPQEVKLAREMAQLAFSLSGLSMIGGDLANHISADDALKQGQDFIKRAMVIFRKHHQAGYYAEALMTEGVLDRTPSHNQKRIYDEALKLCRQTLGEHSVLGARIHINMGIYFEDTQKDQEAYNEFKTNLLISEHVFGKNHIKCQRARGILNETKYVKIARLMKELPPPPPACMPTEAAAT